MLSQTTKEIEAAFKAQNWTYNIDQREDSSALITGFNLKSGDSVQVFFISAGDKDLAIRVFRAIDIPAGKEDIAIRTCNKINLEYRFTKFVVDNGCVGVQLDVAMETQNMGPVAIELISRTLDILEHSLPTFKSAFGAAPAGGSFSGNNADRF